MNRRLMPNDADVAERDPLVRREVIVVPGGVLTVTVFHFDRRAGRAAPSWPVEPAPPLWQRLMRRLARSMTRSIAGVTTVVD